MNRLLKLAGNISTLVENPELHFTTTTTRCGCFQERIIIVFYRVTFSHFLIQLVQSGLNKLPTVWGWLATPFYFGHFAVFFRKYNKSWRYFRLVWLSFREPVCVAVIWRHWQGSVLNNSKTTISVLIYKKNNLSILYYYSMRMCLCICLIMPLRGCDIRSKSKYVSFRRCWRIASL